MSLLRPGVIKQHKPTKPTPFNRGMVWLLSDITVVDMVFNGWQNTHNTHNFC